jgi:hypothetical protein
MAAEHEAVGADDLVAGRVVARQAQLVAGGEQPDPRPAAHSSQAAPSEAARPMASGPSPCRLRARPSRAVVEALLADEEPGRTPLGRLDAPALDRGVLLDQDGIRTLGQQPAGEDARRLAGAEPAPPAAGGDLAHELEPVARAGVRGPHGVAVHRRDGGRRLVAPATTGLGQHPAARLLERHHLGRQGAKAPQIRACASATSSIRRAQSAW